MRILISIGMLMATTVAAYAFPGTPVPEIDAFSGVAAMGIVGSIAALIWERSGANKSEHKGVHNENLDLQWEY